jgi:hypothetical protein
MALPAARLSHGTPLNRPTADRDQGVRRLKMLWKIVVLVSFYAACIGPASACSPNQPKAETFKGCVIFKPAKQAPKHAKRIHKPA